MPCRCGYGTPNRLWETWRSSFLRPYRYRDTYPVSFADHTRQMVSPVPLETVSFPDSGRGFIPGSACTGCVPYRFVKLQGRE